MKRIYLFLWLGIAVCGPALAQVPVAVSPALGLEDFRLPLTCASRSLCAVTSPALGSTPGRFASVPASGAERFTTASLPGPTARPEPTRLIPTSNIALVSPLALQR